MKKRNVRILSLALALGLCLTLLPAASAASAPPDSYTAPSGLTIRVTRPAVASLEGAPTYLGDGVFQVRESSGVFGLYDINATRLGELAEGVTLLGNFHDGLCPVRAYDIYTAETKCGYIDKTGRLAVPARYQEVQEFSDGYAAVKDESGWGYIDAAGTQAIPCQYQQAYPFQNGEAAVEYHVQVQGFSYTRHAFINTAGQIVREFPTRTEMVAVGMSTVPMPWDDCVPVDGLWADGVMLVEKVNTSAEIVDPVDLLPTRYGLLDKSGNVQALPGLDQDPDIDVLSYLGGDRYFVSKMSSRAILSGNGEVVFPYLYYYYDLREFALDTGLAAVTDSGACGLLDRDGNYVISVTKDWTSLSNFLDGISVGSWYNPSGAFIPYVLQLDGASVPVDPKPNPEPAGDQPSSWAQEQVHAAVEAGLVPESLQARYTQTATRAEFCALAVELYETVTGSEITQRAAFSDTSDVNVQKMAGIGVIGGIGNNQFNPNGELTREQAATILVRLADAMGSPLPEGTASFADNASISSWALEAVGRAKAGGIMDGTGSNQFSPQGAYTREQSIMTAYRLYEAMQ